MPEYNATDDETDLSTTPIDKVVLHPETEIEPNVMNSQARGRVVDLSQMRLHSKRKKRGKYITRACSSCQRRKTKCDGGQPCSQCITGKRKCEATPRTPPSKAESKNQSAPSPLKDIRIESESRLDDKMPGEGEQQMQDRLAHIEHQLKLLEYAALGKSEIATNRGSLNTVASIRKNLSTDLAAGLQDILETEGQSFGGEIGIISDFEGIEARLDLSIHIPDELFWEISPLTSFQDMPAATIKSRSLRGWLERIFHHYGVSVEETKWRRYLQVYFDEIHILYPFLHQPSIWRTFNEMWEYSALWPLSSSDERRSKLKEVAIVGLCMCLGRCTDLTRASDEVQAAGWPLYCAALSISQDASTGSNTINKSLADLQIMFLRVLYLFRLDATQSTGQLLATTISSAHFIGIHRQETINKLPAFQGQMFCRLWWCIYIFDRRIALEAGRPFILQDANIDTALPLCVSDAWLEQFKNSLNTIESIKEAISTELSKKPITAIPYLLAKIQYSKIVGKIWSFLYGVQSSTSSSHACKMEYFVDTAIGQFLSSLPAELRYKRNTQIGEGFSTKMNRQQATLLFLSSSYLRLLTRLPRLLSAKHNAQSEDGHLESLMKCIALAMSILKSHEAINNKKFAYCFTVSHYLISTTMVMIGLVSKDMTLKNKYSGVILQSAQSLSIYCHSNWVSGKMMRWVSKLLILARKFGSSSAAEVIETPAFGSAPDWPQPDVLAENIQTEQQLYIDPDDPLESEVIGSTDEDCLFMLSDVAVGPNEEEDEDNLFQLPNEHWQLMMVSNDYAEFQTIQNSWPLLDYTWN